LSVAKSEPKTRSIPRRRGILGGAEVRPSGPILVASAVVGCLALSALLTLEILPAPVVGFAGRPIMVGDISERDEKAPTRLVIADPQATESLRREAVEKSPVVYDFDDNRAAEVRERIGKAFAAARAAQAPAAPPAVGEPPPRTPATAFRESLGSETPVPDVSVQYLDKTIPAATGSRGAAGRERVR
jgi:hypothetical protein